MFCSLKRKIMLLILSGLIMAILSFALYISFPTIMDNAIKKRLVINEDSDSYKYWKDVPVPIYIHFYFFNITNPQEIWDLTSKPVLEEVGPYTFREAREKVNITWNNNGTVSYKQIKRWYYQPDRTNGSLYDVITTLNVPMVAAATKGKEMNEDLIYLALEEIFNHYNTTWFVEKTVEELLFKGYEDPLLKVAKAFMDLPYDKFGWFYARNDTDDGEIVAYTGENNIDAVDEIYSWNGMTEVPSFDPPCNMINGSAGDTWPPNQSYDSKITLFVPDICRYECKFLNQF
ncbi:protein croquemort-like isoform X1 [Stegodyphus dumicola]|uniref:protein croquemort-like isoform X1 n=1 Tax=Stegodyphus dumicola TaxID=202533 RepID=UPI0015A8A39D|nr:protein croquemort-like isoform X1 [Stegodyphus dumicola]XP_035216631.1 protein croquemort-like isoform X1 [Stegodyphus dumicola]